jgi:hypothetical protein
MNHLSTTRRNLTPQEQIKIAGIAQVSLGTVRRWLRGERVQPSLLARIEQAMRELFPTAA